MNRTSNTDICYSDVIDTNFRWPENLPALMEPLPKLVLQMTLSIFVNHGLYLILHFLHQPRIVADIITCLVLSPATLNNIKIRKEGLHQIIFPDKSLTILETVGNLGLLYAMFIQGLHVELSVIAHKTTKTLTLAYSVIVLPFTIGCALYLVYQKKLKEEDHVHNITIECLCWATITATTTFQTLAPFLSKLKLLCTDIGRQALSTGMINGLFSWYLIFFTLALSASPSNIDRYRIDGPATTWVLIAMALLALFSCMVVRPLIVRMVSNVSEGETYRDSTIQLILFLVLAFGLIADLLGSHFIFGAFVFGLCIPNGLSAALIDKIEDCVLGILMPLYFASVGTRLDLKGFVEEIESTWGIILAIFCKAICTICMSPFFNMHISDGLALGVLLSAKGLLPLVVIDIVRDRGHLSTVSYTSLVLTIVISSVMVGPICLVYKRIRKTNQSYEQRTLEGAKPTDELRLITCLQSPRNVPSIINLLEMTNITSQTPVTVFALHLVEQVGHAPAMLIEHASSDSSSSWGIGAKPLFNRIRAHTEKIITAFQDYEEQNTATAIIQTLTVVSPVDSLHEDICNLAENKEATLIILSFHKQRGVDGKLEDTNIEFRAVNQNVLSMSPCSVGLLVDRGLRMLSSSSSSNPTTMGASLNGRSREHIEIAMIYIGGPDDREALTYAWRMAGHPFVSLRVIRFLLGDNPVDCEPDLDCFNVDNVGEQAKSYTILTQNEKEKQLDEAFLYRFQQRTAHDASIHYKEMVSNNGEETVSLLREVHRDYDLYIVGMGDSIVTPLTAGLADWSDCPELGPMGDVLATSEFATNTSVLVIQQYKGGILKYNDNDDENKYDDDKVLTRSFEQP